MMREHFMSNINSKNTGLPSADNRKFLPRALLDVAMSTVTLSTTGQVVIPKEIRDALHWETGAELSLTAVGNGILLKATPKKRGKRLEDLICMLQHDGPPIPIKELCKPVDYSADWEESEKPSR